MISSFTGALLKFKFKQLHNTYRKEKNKLKRASGSSAVPAKVWQYATEMSFVDNVSATRPSTGNLLQPETESAMTSSESPGLLTTSIDKVIDDLDLPPGFHDENSFDNNNYYNDAQLAHGDLLEDSIEPANNYYKDAQLAHGDLDDSFEPPKAKKAKRSNVSNSKSEQLYSILERIEDRKIEAFQSLNKRDQDGDRLFVLSLLPFMKQVCFDLNVTLN